MLLFLFFWFWWCGFHVLGFFMQRYSKTLFIWDLINNPEVFLLILFSLKWTRLLIYELQLSQVFPQYLCKMMLAFILIYSFLAVLCGESCFSGNVMWSLQKVVQFQHEPQPLRPCLCPHTLPLVKCL